jgi:hypothetical protein
MTFDDPYTVTRPQDAMSKLFIREEGGGDDRLLVESARFDVGAARAHIGYWSVSPDGRHLAYSVSVGGAETGALRMMDVALAHDLPQQIDHTRYVYRARPPGRANSSHPLDVNIQVVACVAEVDMDRRRITGFHGTVVGRQNLFKIGDASQ